MKHKKPLLITFFIALFVFQQAQASANILPKDRTSQLNPAQGSGLPAQIYVNMLHLDLDNGGVAYVPHEPCVWLERAVGCGEANTQFPYQNYVALVDVENDYLLDVLPREMNVAENNPPTLEALQAQAVAARSLGAWKTKYISDPWETNGYINNSRDYQVFIPYAYEYYSPSNSALILEAVTSTTGQYLSYGGEAIDAEFGSDMFGETITEPVAFPKDYLKGVQDPISKICGAQNNSNRYGMSQLGAYRWSRGNQCAIGGDANTSWPVTWSDYRQILVHYYTGINIVGSNPSTPEDRWNLLWYDGIPNQMNAGDKYSFKIKLQNTSSTAGWIDPSQVEIGYKWTQGDTILTDWQVAPETTIPSLDISGNPMALGSTGEVTVNFYAPPSACDPCTLHLDLRRKGGDWFSNANWPDARISSIKVTGSATFTPTATSTDTPTLTLTPPITDTPTFTPTFTPPPLSAYSLDFVAMSYGCTFGPYVSCSASETHDKDHGQRLDFNIIFNYNDNSDWAPSTFNITLAFGTGVYDTKVPLYWEMYPVVNDVMPSRSITTQYSGTDDLASMKKRGYWMMGGQPWPYDHFTVKFSRDSGGPEKLVKTDAWHFTIATYNFADICDSVCCWGDKSSSSSSSSGLVLAASNPGRIAQQAALLYRVRDELLNTAGEGLRLTDVYYAHSAEIAAIMNENPVILEQGLDVIDALTPDLQALLDGNGSTVTVTSEQVQQAQAFLDALLPYASPELTQTIEQERQTHPLNEIVGMNMDEAWEHIRGQTPPTFTPTPTVTNTNTPTPTNTETLTPTLTDTPTDTPTPTNTDTPTPTFTNTPTATATEYPLPGSAAMWGTGADGNLVVEPGETYDINAQNHAGRVCSDGGDAVAYNVSGLASNSAALISSPSADCLNAGDEIMLINQRGSSSAYANVGKYEFLRVLSVDGNTVTFTTNKVNRYGAKSTDDSGIGYSQIVRLIRVPNYGNLIVNGTLSGARWSAIAFRVRGQLSGTGTITADGLGYGGGFYYWGDLFKINGVGESRIGWDALAFGGGFPGGQSGLSSGAGGGGGYGTAGASGATIEYNTKGGKITIPGAKGGTTYGTTDLSLLYFGAGGGSLAPIKMDGEGTEHSQPLDQRGGRGGGMIFIGGYNLAFQGTISADGAANHQNSGGGAGGSIRIEGYNVSISTLHALGGNPTAYGGDGGNGRIAVYYVSTLSIPSSAPTAYTGKKSAPPTMTPTKTPTQTNTPTSTSTLPPTLTLTPTSTP